MSDGGENSYKDELRASQDELRAGQDGWGGYASRESSVMDYEAAPSI